MVVLFHNNSLLETCNANGKEYQVGESFIDNNCTEKCTCLGHDGFGCLSLCSPELVFCKQGERKERYKDYFNNSKCFCNRERCVKGNCIILL